jgi:hypothetical protein
MKEVTEGSRSRGARRSRNGAPKPTAMTMSRPLNPGSNPRSEDRAK